MSEFVAKKSQALSVGGTAADVDLSVLKVQDASGRNSTPGLTLGRFVKIENTHATQTMYARKGATATTSAFDIAIGAGKSVITAITPDQRLSLIASGASTTGFLHIGDFIGA